MFKRQGHSKSPGWIGVYIPAGYLAVAMTAFLVFAGTLTHDFIWDDEHIINQARKVVEERGPAALAAVPFAALDEVSPESSGYYRPVTLVSMWLNDPVGRPSPFPYHLVNVLLHVVNSLLVLVLLRMMIPEGPGALLGAAVFAAHPVHAESVAFVSGRTDLFAALFTLVTVILWKKTSGQGNSSVMRILYPLGLGTFILACLSKEVSFILPVVIFLWSLSERHPSAGSGRKPVSRDMLWVMGMFVVLGLLVWFRTGCLGIGMGPGWSSYTVWMGTGPVAMAGEVAVNLLHYLRLMVLPWPMKVYYPPIPPEPGPLTLALSLGFAGTCLAFSRKRHGHIGFLALVWVLLFLVPVSGILGLGIAVIAERFCYLPSVGFALVTGYLLGLGYRKISTSSTRTAFTVLAAAVIVLFFTGGSFHAARWRDNVTLFSHAVRTGPVTVPDIYLNLGNAHVAAGNPWEAIEAYESAIRLDPFRVKAIVNLSSVYLDLDEHEKALEVLARAVKLDPGNAGVRYNTAVVLGKLGRTDEAVKQWTQYLELRPGDAAARYRRGDLLSRLGRYEESAEDYRKAVTEGKVRFKALLGLGRSLEKMGRPDEAVGFYLKAVEERPHEPGGYLSLGRALLGQGKPREAVAVYRMSLNSADPGADAHRGLVLAYYQSGREADAQRHIADLAVSDPRLSRELADLLDGLMVGSENPIPLTR